MLLLCFSLAGINWMARCKWTARRQGTNVLLSFFVLHYIRKCANHYGKHKVGLDNKHLLSYKPKLQNAAFQDLFLHNVHFVIKSNGAH